MVPYDTKRRKLKIFPFLISTSMKKNQYDSSHEPKERVEVAQYAFLKVRKFLIRISLMQLAWLWDPTSLWGS